VSGRCRGGAWGRVRCECGVDDPRVGLGEDDGDPSALVGQLVALAAVDPLDEACLRVAVRRLPGGRCSWGSGRRRVRAGCGWSARWRGARSGRARSPREEPRSTGSGVVTISVFSSESSSLRSSCRNWARRRLTDDPRRPRLSDALQASDLLALGLGRYQDPQPAANVDRPPYSEAQFKTLKHRPGLPARFTSIVEGRACCRQFFPWYNEHHHQSGIGLMIPSTVQPGLPAQTHTARAAVLDVAYAATPNGSSVGRHHRPRYRRARGSTNPTDTQEGSLNRVPSVSPSLTGSGESEVSTVKLAGSYGDRRP
jgi:hypothetical protein